MPSGPGNGHAKFEVELMSKQLGKQRSNVRAFPNIVSDAPANEDVASIIDVLQQQLALAREGKLGSVAVVAVSGDGGVIGTQWSCAPGDTVSLIGQLTVLAHDLMSARK
jgi:hypothetical protein